LKELQNNFLASDYEIDHTAPHPTTRTIALKWTEVKSGSKCTHRAKEHPSKVQSQRFNKMCSFSSRRSSRDSDPSREETNKQTNKQTKPAEKVTKVSDFVKPFWKAFKELTQIPHTKTN
jgi:hypothetical protein